MKALDEVEARRASTAEACPGDAGSVIRIDEPGSCYLTGSVFGEAGKHGIEVAASGVTIDLNGFEVVGVEGLLSGVLDNGDIVAFVGVIIRGCGGVRGELACRVGGEFWGLGRLGRAPPRMRSGLAGEGDPSLALGAS
ncbi:MAG: hypothetical protein ACF8Q5_00855 [Phycisphaerales bacterium JB040]